MHTNKIQILTFLALFATMPTAPYKVVNMDSDDDMSDDVLFDAGSNSHVSYDQADRTFYVSSNVSDLPDNTNRIVRGVNTNGMIFATALSANGDIDTELNDDGWNDVLHFTAQRLDFSQALDYDDTGITKIVDPGSSWSTVIGTQTGEFSFEKVNIGKTTVALSVSGHLDVVDGKSAVMTVIPSKDMKLAIAKHSDDFKISKFLDGARYGKIDISKLKGYDDNKTPIATRVYSDTDVMATVSIGNYGWAFKVTNTGIELTLLGPTKGIVMQTLGRRGLVKLDLCTIVDKDESVRFDVPATELALETPIGTAFSNQRAAA
ncbi:hypothetical protein HON52_00205 [Candidatus Uhrbacteria bacterium]|nr:hypothetical protein [Candidatus Uhrbacteria bacterium]